MKKIDGPDIEFEAGDDILSSFERVVADKPDETALIFKERRMSWGELGGNVNRVANALLALGVSKGDRVAILSKNSVEFVETFFGSLAAGACAVPLPTMASAEALKLMLEDSRPKALVVSAEMRALVEPSLDGLDCLAAGGRIGSDFEGGGWQGYERWIEGSSDAAPGVAIDKGDQFNIIYSSGTTGVPKGIVHTHAARVAFADGLEGIFSAPGMVNIISTPLYSNTTMVTWLSSMRWGSACVIMEKFDTREFLQLCETEKVNLAMLVPVQYERILQVEDLDSFDLSSMMVKFSTSAPLRADTKRRILDKIPGELVEFYGLTEGGVTTVLVASQNTDKLDSVGQAGQGEVRIIDDEGNELQPGETGEIVGRQGYMMTGYLNRDGATEEMLWFDEEGLAFLRTGDTGRMDEDGFLYVSGRKKDIIISGGLNIYAIDLEDELLKSDAVADAAVIAIPSEQWGETPLAFVVLEKGAEESAENLREWVNARLGKSQRISRVEFLDEIPRSNIGKILKRELRKPYWDDAPSPGGIKG